MARLIALCLFVVAIQAQSPPVTPAQRIRELQQAVRLHPDDAQIRIELGRALHAVGDLANAEAELREAVGRLPESAPAHNELGAVLLEQGNIPAARDEFRTAARLAPDDANAQANLDRALAASRQSGNDDTRIRVDVRQVLVPVVVTDKEGHHVTGLTQQDFTVLEDGVEQEITTFSVEHSGTPETATPASPVASVIAEKEARPADAHSAPRRTFVICIDTLHGTFNNFVSAREALKKLFQRERSEDSQYVVVALGTTAEIVLNTTRDPNAVLGVLQNKHFQSLFLSGQVGGLKSEMERYRRDLNEVRIKCDMADRTTDMLPKMGCDVGKKRVPGEAEFIAELDRTLTVGFLRQLRFLVTQLATAKDRRTVVLLSDGFQLAPGRQAYELLSAFFPDLKDFSLRSGERLQNEFEPILQLASRSNVTVDTIDTRGLYGIGSFDASVQGSTVSVSSAVDHVDRNIEMTNGEPLIEIAKATGGTAFRDSNDLLSGLERAFADGRDYYTLGYTSTNASQDGKFRTITVQVRGRNLTINAKRGYWSERAAQ